MEIVIILALILLNGFFSMAEMAMVSSRKTKLETMANRGSRAARKTLKILNEPDKFLSTIQIGVTLMGILTGIFSGESIQRDLTAFFMGFESVAAYASPLATTVIVVIVTYFTLVFGELVPKRVGMTHPEKIAQRLTPFMNVLSRAVYPFIWLLSVSTRLVAKLLNIKGSESIASEEEIKAIISDSVEHGEIKQEEQEIIERVFHLGDRNISSLMTHRSDIRRLDIDMNLEDVKEYIYAHPTHSIYPVCEGDIDRIKGIVRTKDIFTAAFGKSLSDLCRPVLFVPENNSAFQVMELFKAKGIYTCFVVDEYGTLQGMVTLKDIFEAIVGDLPEVDDGDEIPVVRREDGSYWVDAQIPFFDFLDFFGFLDKVEVVAEDFDTLAGFILDILQRIPEVGEVFEWEGLAFEIADMDGQRIDKVLVTEK